MTFKRWILVVVSFFAFYSSAKADDPSVYEIISSGNTTDFAELMAYGLDVDERDANGYTPLIIASSLGQSEFVQFLLDNGANPNNCNKDGMSALHFAALNGHTNVINALVDADAMLDVVNGDGLSPLMLAIKNNRRFVVELLVKRGATINIVDKAGNSPIDLAAKYRYKDIEKFLRSARTPSARTR